eukprot:TRINITY_DN12894_c0_g1_i2.p5 TRINITY_DN12894_c0_g1~~TRINITY_DN12894_c0_g1_i2.p5  ORF type:complete len:110 (-),score=19.58 TRINITY_DN12894_c0_g1_i2:59-388(-)
MSSTGASVFEITQSLGEVDAARIKRLLEGGVKIPPQPRVLEELRKHMKRSEMDVRLLARVINQDPGLTAMLFKVCLLYTSDAADDMQCVDLGGRRIIKKKKKKTKQTHE